MRHKTKRMKSPHTGVPMKRQSFAMSLKPYGKGGSRHKKRR